LGRARVPQSRIRHHNLFARDHGVRHGRVQEQVRPHGWRLADENGRGGGGR
jgi:hypothetical protein